MKKDSLELLFVFFYVPAESTKFRAFLLWLRFRLHQLFDCERPGSVL